jgi:glycosyltransferase involved in cell wall biosynthesis
MKFKIIIPTYNSEKWIKKCIDSVLSQTYKDFMLVLVDDMSTDNTVNLIKEYNDERIYLIRLEEKRYNGGTRNVGIQAPLYSDYTLFLDSDDWFYNDIVLERINDTIIRNYMPDCVSLSYNCLIGENENLVSLKRNNRKELVESIYVACWTKCIKSSLIQLFPENTLMEDVVQHIKQCDVIESVVSIEEPIVIWNRNNLNSCSREENQNLQNGKWQSSMYRYCADLMDLSCKTNECENHRKWRLDVVLDNIKKGKYIQ